MFEIKVDSLIERHLIGTERESFDTIQNIISGWLARGNHEKETGNHRMIRIGVLPFSHTRYPDISHHKPKYPHESLKGVRSGYYSVYYTA